MKKKMTDKHKVIAYVLSTDADLNANKKITQKEISDILGVSQPTIALSNKETALKLQNEELQRQLSEAKQEILRLDGIENFSLPGDCNNEYRRKW